MEIERKFVIETLPEGLPLGAGMTVRQGYAVVAEAAELRLRVKGGRHLLTVKKGSGLAREEYEIELSAEQFDAMWPATAGRRLEKTRLLLELGRHTAEIDVYEGALAGLITAEVEFESTEEAAAFEPPGWFGREVTGDDRWANRNLALGGRPTG
jgi:CYTH domain-containing protein